MDSVSRIFVRARSWNRAQARRHVQSPAAIALLDGNGLSRVDPDPDGQRQVRIRSALLGTRLLEFQGRPHRLGRRLEDREGLVTPQFEDAPATGLDGVPREVGELLGQRRSRGVTPFPGEAGVAADVRDHEAQRDRARLGSSDSHPRAPFPEGEYRVRRRVGTRRRPDREPRTFG